MCEPLTIAAIGMGLGAVGTAASVSGQIGAGAAAAEQADLNRALSEASAADALQRGEFDAGKVRTEGSRIIGQQRAELAASGIDISTGSALDLFEDTRVMSELDAQTIRNNAWREAWGYKTQGLEYEKRGRAQQTQALFGAAGTLLGGVGDIASSAATFGGRLRRGGNGGGGAY